MAQVTYAVGDWVYCFSTYIINFCEKELCVYKYTCSLIKEG